MATRRKYHASRGYSDGRVVTPEPSAGADVPPPMAAPAEATPAVSEIADIRPPSAPEPSVLQQQIAAAQRADELQRQAPPQQQAMTPEQQLAAHIDGLPISDFKKAFLLQYPQLLVEPLIGDANKLCSGAASPTTSCGF